MAKTEDKAPVVADVANDAGTPQAQAPQVDQVEQAPKAQGKAQAKDEKDYRLTRAYVHGHTLLARDAIITLNARQAEFLLADGTIVGV